MIRTSADGRLGGDAHLGVQRLERLGAQQVPRDGVAEVLIPVEEGRPGDVAVLVGGVLRVGGDRGVVDLEQPIGGIVCGELVDV
jgi:hypothetical protein